MVDPTDAHSEQVLNQVARTVLEDPEARSIQIEGYYYSEMKVSDNLDRSADEAQAVMVWLQSHAVPASRFAQPVGKGNNTEESAKGNHIFIRWVQPPR